MKKSNGAKTTKANGKKGNGKAKANGNDHVVNGRAKKAKAKAEAKPPLEPGQARCTCGWVGMRTDLDEDEGADGERQCPECGVRERFLELGPEPEKPAGVLLSKGTALEVDEPMDGAELRAAKAAAIEAKGALSCAEHAVEVAKRELKAAKEQEESCRAAWDELALRLAKGAKKVKVTCRVLLEHDGKVRSYRVDTGELIDERDPTRDELKQAKQPSLPLDDQGDDDGGMQAFTPTPAPPPAAERVVDYDDAGPDAFDPPALEGEYYPPARQLPAHSGDDLADGPEAA